MFPANTTPRKLNQFIKGSMSEFLGIEYLEIGTDFIKAKMPVDHRTCQPFGRLHGGASMVLAEELGSMAANLLLDNKKQVAVGLDINGNHLKGASKGFVVGIAKPIHLGKRYQVWEIKVENEDRQLVCISRLTVAIIEKY
jgi:1,4-dihydroxy-2-naphthoyl-CoA hydrolase